MPEQHYVLLAASAMCYLLTTVHCTIVLFSSGSIHFCCCATDAHWSTGVSHHNAVLYTELYT